MGRVLLGRRAGMVWLCQTSLLWGWFMADRGVEGVGMAEPLRFVDILNKNNPWLDSTTADDIMGSWTSFSESGESPRSFRQRSDANEIVATEGYDNQSHVNNEDNEGYEKNDNVKELFLVQRLDHFAPSQEHVLMQRYFYSDRLVDPSKELQYAFLCVGGEGPAMDKSVLVDSVHCSGDMLELAVLLKEQGASVYLFGLEHRYYGRSYPAFKDEKGETVSPVTNDNLVYLSSRQALADLAHFVTKMTATPNQGVLRGGGKSNGPSDVEGMVPSSSKWVTFGGSYPGMLAGWARLKYPHLIHAAVSNSAPVQAEVDMASYNNRVAFDLQYDLVGGSATCFRIFEEGHAQLVNALENNDASLLQHIGERFNLCDPSELLDRGNAQEFLGDGVVELHIQSNDPSCQEEMCNIEKVSSVYGC